MSLVSVQDVFKAGVHFGHKRRFWNPKMSQFIFGVKSDIHIIDLDKSLPMLNEALDFIRGIASRRGKILFVGTKRACHRVIAEEATRAGMPYVNNRWLGGMLTNYKTVRQSIKRLKAIEKMVKDGTITKFTKKEALEISREQEKLERNLGGIKNMGTLPDALFVIDVGREKIAVQEAKRLGIPVIGIVDTNNTPDDIDYVIPGNDDSYKAIRLYAKSVADVILSVKDSSEELSKEKFSEVETSENIEDVLGFVEQTEEVAEVVVDTKAKETKAKETKSEASEDSSKSEK